MEAREEADERFQLVYVEAVSLENRTDTEKKWPCLGEQ